MTDRVLLPIIEAETLVLLFYDLVKQSNKEIISETSMEWFLIKPRCEKQGVAFSYK